MIKLGTVKEFTNERQKLKALPEKVRREVQNLVEVLDEAYGPERNVDTDDGGYVLIAFDSADVKQIKKGLNLGTGQEEAVDIIRTPDGEYLNALYLRNNEYGINIVMPLTLAPTSLRQSAR